MIPVISVYQDVRDNVNSAENGQLSYSLFNRLSRRAEMRMIDYISGDIEGRKPPIPDLTQKNRDWLAMFVETKPINIVNGKVDRPADYYGWDNAYLIGTYSDTQDCDTEDEDDGCNTMIELMSPQKFHNRCNTFIKGLKPSFKKPIAKLVGKRIEFMPKDLGSITIEYIRLPKFAKIVSKVDAVYNDEIADENLSTNYEWDESARELLVWFITDTFAIHTREQALKQQNAITGKLTRDQQGQ